MLSQATIEELRQILGEEYGRKISQAEASEIALGMVGYFDGLAQVYHQEKTKNDNDDNNEKSRRI